MKSRVFFYLFFYIATVFSSSANAPEGYVLTWSDEFSGTTVDEAEWNYRVEAKMGSVCDKKWVSVANGNMRIACVPIDSVKYSGGGLITKRKFSSGYFEVAAKIDGGYGWHDSFWRHRITDASDSLASPIQPYIEVDCLEKYSTIPANQFTYGTIQWIPRYYKNFYNTPVLVDVQNRNINRITQNYKDDLSSAFHIYGFELKVNDYLAFYFDNQLLQVVDLGGINTGDDAHLWLTTLVAISGKAQAKNGESLFDYLRCYTMDSSKYAARRALLFASEKYVHPNLPAWKVTSPVQLKAKSELKIVNLIWCNNLNTATVYIERSKGANTNFELIATLSGDVQQYSDIVPDYDSYTYRIKNKIHTGVVSDYASYKINVAEFTNVVLNKKTYANTTLSTTYSSLKAVDGDTTSTESRWCNERNIFPAILKIDLDGTYRINELKLFTGYLGYNTPIANFSFQYWNGVSWVNAISETTNISSQYKKSFPEVRTDSVRLYVDAVNGGLIRLYEIQVNGSKVENTSGVKNNHLVNNQYVIYPNPTTGWLNIREEDRMQRMEILDSTGRILINAVASKTIDLSFLSNGIYFLRIDGQSNFRIIKKQIF